MRRRDDAGYTLAEVLVSMSVMAIMMVIVTTAILDIYGSVNRTDGDAEAQTQISSMFLRLDKEIRYAGSISDPAEIDDVHYVEYVVEIDEVRTCVQLRLVEATNELQRRQWVQAVSPVSPTSWTTLASHITGTTPFTVTQPDINGLTGFRYQRLALNVTATVGVADKGAERATSVTFTALNATSDQNNNGTCIEARGVDS